MVHFFSFSIVKDDSECMPMAGPKPAYTMTQVDSIGPARTLHRASPLGLQRLQDRKPARSASLHDA
jgi:hypothetical protein